MGNQASKRVRNQRKVREIQPVVFGRSGTGIDDRLWIFRRVGGQSLAGLRGVAETIKPHEAAPKFGGYTLSVMYPGEVYKATRHSDLKGFIDARRIAERLRPKLPESFKGPVTADIQGISQYHGTIGVHVTYEEFDEERQTITTALNEILGINHEWEISPHISIASGRLANLSNVKDLEFALPRQVYLGRAQTDFNR